MRDGGLNSDYTHNLPVPLGPGIPLYNINIKYVTDGDGRKPSSFKRDHCCSKPEAESQYHRLTTSQLSEHELRLGLHPRGEPSAQGGQGTMSYKHESNPHSRTRRWCSIPTWRRQIQWLDSGRYPFLTHPKAIRHFYDALYQRQARTDIDLLHSDILLSMFEVSIHPLWSLWIILLTLLFVVEGTSVKIC
jgi:hypothetical protein